MHNRIALTAEATQAGAPTSVAGPVPDARAAAANGVCEFLHHRRLFRRSPPGLVNTFYYGVWGGGGMA